MRVRAGAADNRVSRIEGELWSTEPSHSVSHTRRGIMGPDNTFEVVASRDSFRLKDRSWISGKTDGREGRGFLYKNATPHRTMLPLLERLKHCLILRKWTGEGHLSLSSHLSLLQVPNWDQSAEISKYCTNRIFLFKEKYSTERNKDKKWPHKISISSVKKANGKYSYQLSKEGKYLSAE